jgi:hypothetical protein
MPGGNHRGRPSSWVAVSVIFIGFLVGGVAMLLGPDWPLFWGGAAVVVAGCLLAAVVNITSDVVLDEPRRFG